MNPTLNKHQKDFLTLQAVYDSSKDLSEYVIRNDQHTTLIASEKKIYVYFKKNELNSYDIKTFLCNFVNTNLYNVTIDICTFKTPKIKQKINLFVETVLYEQHKQYNLKNKCQTKDKNKCTTLKKENVKYNFQTLTCQEKCPAGREREKFIQDNKTAFQHALIKNHYVNFARDIQDFPPNIGTAEHIANTIVEKVKSNNALKVTILKEAEMKALKMELALSVNAGSKNEPRLVAIEYCTDPSLPKTAIVGKGITFDTGGYNLKPSAFIKDMKFDMSGAVVATSAVLAVAEAKANANVVAITVLVENAIGTIPESVITAMNGKTVQIDNTDAEGRLTLGDAVTYAIHEHKADRIITIATLTGAVLIALGVEKTGVFSDDTQFYENFAMAACYSNEQI